MTTIVVEGIGDIVSKPTGYGRALRKLIIDKEHEGDHPRVIFVDVCDDWAKANDLDLPKTRKETRDKLCQWGAEFLDKSESNRAQRKQYDELLNQRVDAVFIATPDRYHIAVAKYWLTGNCKRIFIEKPLSNDPAEATAWMAELRKQDRGRLIQLDHYLLKIHSHFKYSDPRKRSFDDQESGNQILQHIGQFKRLRFYMLEDHSGTDREYLRASGREQRRRLNGPIEIENRIDALQDGVALDLLPHLLALLTYFGDPRTFEVTELRPARYTGVEFDDRKEAGIAGETFAAIKFNFRNHKGINTEGEAYIGKGIRGSTKYPSMKGNVKVLEVEGAFGNRVELDFNSSIVTSITKESIDPPAYGDSKPICDLEPDPYYYLLRNVVFKRIHRGADLGIPTTTGALILDTIVSEITSRTKSATLQTYKLGNKSGRLPPLLEDLLIGGSEVIHPLT